MANRRVLIVIFITNYICLCKTNVTSTSENQLLSSIIKPFASLPCMPKNYVLTNEEININTQNYLIGVKNEDIYLNGTQLIQKYGYNVEEHQVITSDGYILSMYRIPGKGRVVFLMHGFTSSYLDWLTIGPEKGLAYLLALAGYDVWMGNARGNTFSKRHIRLSPSDPKFWDFSWDEIGRLDLPAMIDYVLKTTGQERLTYVGHSQGTTAFFVLCSEIPKYNDKFDLMIALSAVAWMKHVISPFVQIASRFRNVLYELAKILGLNELVPDNDLKKAITLTLCGDSFHASLICSNIAFLLFGFDYPQIDFHRSPVIFNHFPQGSSLKQALHYAQLVVSGYFRRYDHGPYMNLIKYGSTTPPSYPVDKITVPTAIFYSPGDWLANPTDVDVLRRKLKHVVDYYQINLKTFNHADYLWAKDVKSLVNDRVLELIKENVGGTNPNGIENSGGQM